jgi:hypothetical protein
MGEVGKYYYRLAPGFKMRVAIIGTLWLFTGLICAAELNVSFDRTFTLFPGYMPSQSSGTECVKPLAWALESSEQPKLLVAMGRNYMKGPASDIRSTLIWQTYSADGKNEDEVLANVVGSGIESGYATSINGQPIALIVDYASRVSLVRSSGSNIPTEVKSIEGKLISGGSKARIIATETAVWLITQQENEVALDQYDENLKLVTSTKVKFVLPSSARLMDAVTGDSGRTMVLAVHELPPNVALARVQLITVESATGKVIHTASVDGFNPVAVAYGTEVYFSRVVVKGEAGKRASEVWIGKLSANGKKLTEWRSHKQEAGTLFSSMVVTKDQVSVISARGYRLFVKRFSKRGAPLGEYQDTSKFQSPLFGYPAVAANNLLFIAQVYREGEARSICGALRVVGFK